MSSSDPKKLEENKENTEERLISEFNFEIAQFLVTLYEDTVGQSKQEIAEVSCDDFSFRIKEMQSGMNFVTTFIFYGLHIIVHFRSL